MTHIDTGPLSWILPEIRVAAAEAQEALTKYRVNPNDAGSLHLSINRVHDLHGALQILDISGLPVVSEAVEGLLKRFELEPEVVTPQAIEAVDDALTAIVVYCEELLEGVKHQPLRLFPYLRDLLTERGAERIHPADLFFPDLSARLPDQKAPAAPSADELAKILRVARQRYEAGLLPFLQGDMSDTSLSNLREALDTVANYQGGSYSRAFWKATVALIDALRSKGLTVDLNVKRFVARLNLQVKRVVDGAPQVAERLFKDCLYFVACARSSEPSVRQVQLHFGLLGTIPADFENTRFIRVDRSLLTRAKEKLAQMKGVWNQAAGLQDADHEGVKRGRIEPLEQFIKDADALGSWLEQLQLAHAHRLVQSLITAVSINLTKQILPSDSLGLEVASAILYLELLLNAVHSPDARRDERINAIISRVQAASEGRDPGAPEAWLNEIARREQDKITLHTLAKELAAQLASIEKNLDAFFRNPTDKSSIAGNEASLTQIEGALGLLGLTAVQQAVSYIRAQLAVFATEEYLPNSEDFTALAHSFGRLTLAIESFARDQDLAHDRYEFDQASGQLRENPNRFKFVAPQIEDKPTTAVNLSATQDTSEVSLEETMLTHQKKTAELFNALNSQPNNQALKEDLSKSLLRMRDDAVIMDSASLMSGARRALQVLNSSGSDPVDMQALAVAMSSITPVEEKQAPAQQPAAPAVVAVQKTPSIDTELLDIFLEEAKEVLSSLEKNFPLLEASPSDQELLTTIRRGFHTLKGSGRMVGLNALGEAAWSIEQLLNHWLAQAKPVIPALMNLLENATIELKEWIAEIAEKGNADRSPLIFSEAADTLEQTGQFQWSKLTSETASETSISALTATQASIQEKDTQQESSDLLETEQKSKDSSLMLTIAQAIEDVLAPPVIEQSTSMAPSLEEKPPADVDMQDFTVEEKNQYVELEQVKRIGSLNISLPLYNIYVTEADENLRQLAQDLAEWQHENSRPVSDQALRLAHTLAGSAATVGASSLHELASALERVLLTCNREQRLLDKDQAKVLVDTVACLSEMQTTFASGELPADEPQRIAALKTLDDVLSQAPGLTDLPQQSSDQTEIFLPETLESVDPAIQITINANEEAVQLESLLTKEALVPDSPREPEVLNNLTQAALSTASPEPPSSSLTEVASGQNQSWMFSSAAEPTEKDWALTKASEESTPAAEDNTLVETPVLEVQTFSKFEEPAYLTSVSDSLLPDQGRTSPGWVYPDINTKDEFEPELFELFAQEAQDAFAAIGQILRKWQDNPQASEPGQALLRILHTLKGSARMAGALRIGQNAHELETRIEQLINEQGITTNILEEFHQRFDRMQLLFEVAQGLAPEAALHQQLVNEVPPVQSSAEQEALPDFTAGSAAIESTQDNIIAFPTPVLANRKPWVTAQAQEVQTPASQTEVSQSSMVRVRSDILDRLVNQAGEVSISRSRVEAEVEGIKNALSELTENVMRLRGQLREIEIQAESQMASRLEMQRQMEVNFDPLEFDRFTRLQELTRLMAESVSDVATVQNNLNRSLMETERDLTAQARLTRELTQDLMRVRMIPFDSVSDRLYRVVRQAGRDTAKRVQLDIRGAAVEVDRSVLERMVGPFEHLLRNAIAHGIESPDLRKQRAKNEVGQISIDVRQEGNEMRILFSDDGNGLDLERIKSRAIERNLIKSDAIPTEQELTNLIFSPGFSTATELTELAGRGVGMDVVRTETALLGGRISVESKQGIGTSITIFLPLTLAVTQVVLVRVGNHILALPSALVAEVQHLKAPVLTQAYQEGRVQSRGVSVPLQYLGHLLELEDTTPVAQRYSPIVIMAQAQERTAIHVDEVIGNREVVVKNIGPQLARVLGISGATVLGSGEVVLIINPIPIAQRFEQSETRRGPILATDSPSDKETPVIAKSINVLPTLNTLPVVMVVDDSLTVRRISERLLTRAGYQVVLAKDGVDALRQLQEVTPDVILVDIEMPRMDGFDLTRNIRSDQRYATLPIIMITSRTADKHRNVAMQLGVNLFLGKPFQDEELLHHINQFISAKAEV